jgi:hypothetical protein
MKSSWHALAVLTGADGKAPLTPVSLLQLVHTEEVNDAKALSPSTQTRSWPTLPVEKRWRVYLIRMTPRSSSGYMLTCSWTSCPLMPETSIAQESFRSLRSSTSSFGGGHPGS